ncbi:MAG: rhodanese-like domain-containing protein [Chloroflexi bacterium]|nr:rhodanese-like domain-containing protein [Chloroflexota bacterium]
MSKTNHRKAAQRSWLPWASVLVAAVLVIAAGAVWAFSSANAPATSTYPAEIGLADAVAKRAAGAFILDVRQPDEWADYHVPGSTLIPLEQLEARARELPRDREVVVVCRSGNRSATGRDILKKAGFSQVTSLAGGLSQWKAAGHPTVSGP